MNPVCPNHNIELVAVNTRYGVRYGCPMDGCTVALWEKNKTATPADEETRAIRSKCHRQFDPLWKSRKFRRSELYRQLSEYLKLPIEKTHIGMFDKDTCVKVLFFCRKRSRKKAVKINR